MTSAATYRYRFGSMGCPCEITIEGADQATAEWAARQGQAEVDRLDRKYSHYRDDSLIAAWAAAAGSSQVFELDPETLALLNFAQTLHAQSEGSFDVTAGPLTGLWDARHGQVPDETLIAAALMRTGWHRLRYSPPTLSIPQPGMRVDLGGIVKEYAADRAAASCRSLGIAHGMVDLGGDLAVIGAHPDGSAWQVGIKNPGDTTCAIADIAISSGGLATSGDYERALVVDGRRYSHIIDARSGWPVDSYASVSVVAPSCLVAGAASTLAMLLGPQHGERYLRSLGLPFLCVTAAGQTIGA